MAGWRRPGPPPSFALVSTGRRCLPPTPETAESGYERPTIHPRGVGRGSGHRSGRPPGEAERPERRGGAGARRRLPRSARRRRRPRSHTDRRG